MAKKKTMEVEVAVAEVVDFLRITGGFAPALQMVVQRKVAAEAARKSGLKVTAKQLQKAADAFRAANGLTKASDTKKWLRGSGISVDAFEEYLETNLLMAKLKDKLAAKTPKRKFLATPAVTDAVREMIFQEWLDKALA